MKKYVSSVLLFSNYYDLKHIIEVLLENRIVSIMSRKYAKIYNNMFNNMFCKTKISDEDSSLLKKIFYPSETIRIIRNYHIVVIIVFIYFISF